MKRARLSRYAAFSLLEVMVAIILVAMAGVMFTALIPTAAKTSKMVGNYSQACSIIQHKVDQLRAVGYGRLNYLELKNASIIDPEPSEHPFHFTQVDGLGELFVNPNGTINIEDWDANTKKVTISLTWTGSAQHQANGDLAIEILISRG